MNAFLDRIIADPWAFLLICIGLAVVLRAVGAHQLGPRLFALCERLVALLWQEFTKPRGRRTRIELIDVILILVFFVPTLLTGVCAIIPPAFVQAFGVPVPSEPGPVIACFMRCLMFLLVACIVSPLWLLLDRYEAVVRALVTKALSRSNSAREDNEAPTKPSTPTE
jgi:hypothetical protein